MKYLKLVLIKNTLQFKNNKLHKQMLYILKQLANISRI